MKGAPQPSATHRSLLQGSRDAGESRLKGGPKRLYRSKRDTSRNQSILDSCRARLVIPELAKTLKHLYLLVVDLVVARLPS